MRILIVLLLFACYTMGCIHFAIQAGGAGHGTLILFAPLISWPLLIVVAVSIGLRRKRISLFMTTVLLGTHHLVNLMLIVGYVIEGSQAFTRMLSISRDTMLTGIFWYLLGQLGLAAGLLLWPKTELDRI